MKNTKNEELRFKLIALVKSLLNDYETDIETGIEDGTYEAAENVDSRNFIQESKDLIAAFEKQETSVMVFVKGGVVQGASATQALSFIVFDEDNFEACNEEEEKNFVEIFGTPDIWDEMIKTKTESGELVPVF